MNLSPKGSSISRRNLPNHKKHVGSRSGTTGSCSRITGTKRREVLINQRDHDVNSIEEMKPCLEAPSNTVSPTTSSTSTLDSCSGRSMSEEVMIQRKPSSPSRRLSPLGGSSRSHRSRHHNGHVSRNLSSPSKLSKKGKVQDQGQGEIDDSDTNNSNEAIQLCVDDPSNHVTIAISTRSTSDNSCRDRERTTKSRRNPSRDFQREHHSPNRRSKMSSSKRIISKNDNEDGKSLLRYDSKTILPNSDDRKFTTCKSNEKVINLNHDDCNDNRDDQLKTVHDSSRMAKTETNTTIPLHKDVEENKEVVLSSNQRCRQRRMNVKLLDMKLDVCKVSTRKSSELQQQQQQSDQDHVGEEEDRNVKKGARTKTSMRDNKRSHQVNHTGIENKIIIIRPLATTTNAWSSVWQV